MISVITRASKTLHGAAAAVVSCELSTYVVSYVPLPRSRLFCYYFSVELFSVKRTQGVTWSFNILFRLVLRFRRISRFSI